METNEILDNLKSSGYITMADPNDNIKKLANLGEGGGGGEIEPGDGENSFVQKGSNAVAFGTNSVAFGTSTTNAKERGITEESTDEEIIEEWKNSDPESDKFALVKGEGALIEGNNNLALGKNSHAEGNGTIAGNNSSHSEGTGTQALGKYAHAEGLETKALGERSHAEGQETEAHGKQSHAEGKHTIAGANGSHTEGLLEPDVNREFFDDRIKSAATESTLYQTLDYSTAAEQYEVGYILWQISTDGQNWQDVRSQNIKVVDVYSGGSTWFKLSKKLKIGNKATRYATFITSETEAYPAQTTGEYSHAEGVSTETTNRGEHAEGTYNKSNANTISSVGIGTSHDDRKNAWEVMKNGDAYLIGVGGYDGTNAGEKAQTLQSIIAALAPYILPMASGNTLGGVKVGSGLSIDGNGVLSASGGGGSSALFVEGALSELSTNRFRFTPSAGKEDPSWGDAAAAFVSGRGVILFTNRSGEPEYFSVYNVNMTGDICAGGGDMIVAWPESE